LVLPPDHLVLDIPGQAVLAEAGVELGAAVSMVGAEDPGVAALPGHYAELKTRAQLGLGFQPTMGLALCLQTTEAQPSGLSSQGIQKDRRRRL